MLVQVFVFVFSSYLFMTRSSAFNVNSTIWVLICVYFLCVCPSSAESPSISMAVRQVAKFLDQVLSLCKRLELCILWYMVQNMPYKDATAVTVWINILFIDWAHCQFPHALPQNLLLLLLVVSHCQIQYMRSVLSHSLLSAFFICSFNTLDNVVLLSPHNIALFYLISQ